MKIIFVDAENIGLKELEKIQASIVDKVFVFSKVEAIKKSCDKLLYLFISDYPEGANQADFYIIAHLSKILVSLSEKEMSSITFELFSNDKSLISAFTFQCKLLGGNCKSIQTKSDVVVYFSPVSLKETIYNGLKIPTELNVLQDKLNLSKSEFTREISRLIKEDKIKRTVENKKKWVQVRK